MIAHTNNEGRLRYAEAMAAKKIADDLDALNGRLKEIEIQLIPIVEGFIGAAITTGSEASSNALRPL